jgi:hypothetical protein
MAFSSASWLRFPPKTYLNHIWRSQPRLPRHFGRRENPENGPAGQCREILLIATSIVFDRAYLIEHNPIVLN